MSENKWPYGKIRQVELPTDPRKLRKLLEQALLNHRDAKDEVVARVALAPLASAVELMLNNSFPRRWIGRYFPKYYKTTAAFENGNILNPGRDFLLCILEIHEMDLPEQRRLSVLAIVLALFVRIEVRNARSEEYAQRTFAYVLCAAEGEALCREIEQVAVTSQEFLSSWKGDQDKKCFVYYSSYWTLGLLQKQISKESPERILQMATHFAGRIPPLVFQEHDCFVDALVCSEGGRAIMLENIFAEEWVFNIEIDKAFLAVFCAETAPKRYGLIESTVKRLAAMESSENKRTLIYAVNVAVCKLTKAQRQTLRESALTKLCRLIYDEKILRENDPDANIRVVFGLAFKKNKHFLQDFVLHLESEFEAEDETKDPFQLLRITSQMWNLLDVLEWIFASPNLFQHQDEAVRKSLERAISSFVEFCENNWLASHGGIVSPLAKALYHREELFSVPQKESALRFVLDRVERGRFGCWELTEVLGRRFYPKVSKRLSSLENPNSNHLNALAACGATDKELLEFQGLTLVVSE